MYVCVYETESIRLAPLNLLSSEAIVLCSTSLYWFHRARAPSLFLFLPPSLSFSFSHSLGHFLFFFPVPSLLTRRWLLPLAALLFFFFPLPLFLRLSVPPSFPLRQSASHSWGIMYTLTFSHLSIDAYWFWYHNEINYFSLSESAPTSRSSLLYLHPSIQSLCFRGNVIGIRGYSSPSVESHSLCHLQFVGLCLGLLRTLLFQIILSQLHHKIYLH